MTNTETTSQPANDRSGADDSYRDPRLVLAKVIEPLDALIASASDPELLSRPTPCDDFTVSDLLDHLVHIARRVAVIGNGGHFAEADEVALESGWSETFQSTANEIKAAWADPAKLEAPFDVPWGQGLPGVAVLFAYCAEFATHGWDLAQGIGADYDADQGALEATLVAAKFIPAEGRDHPMVPFGPVTEAPEDATTIETIVAWMGRTVTG